MTLDELRASLIARLPREQLLLLLAGIAKDLAGPLTTDRIVHCGTYSEVMTWIDDHITQDSASRLRNDAAWASWIAFCAKHGLRPCARNTFGAHLTELLGCAAKVGAAGGAKVRYRPGWRLL